MTDCNAESNDGLNDIPATTENFKSQPETSLASMNEQHLQQDLSLLEQLAEGKAIRIPKNPQFSRKDVVDSFQTAFELVGGVPRLALWANENYTTFVKLYARLLPSQSNSALGEANTLRIEIAIPASPLDELPPEMGGNILEHEAVPD